METDIRKKLYIKIFYSLLDWEWYSEPNTFRVFMHLLLTANRKDQPYQGDVIRRGEALASLEYLSDSLNLSVRNIRTAIKHLKSTGEVTTRKIQKTSVIRVVNYDRYQSGDKSSDNELPIKRQECDSKVPTKRHFNDNEVTTLRYCNNEENEIMKECESETHAHGKFNNVFITDSEYEQFRSDYPSIAEEVIEELSVKIATGDSRYKKGHIGHLYIFAKNYTEPKKAEHKPSFDIDLAMKRSRMIDPTKTKRNKQ